MYSKSYTANFEPASTLRMNSNAGTNYKNNQSSTVPVKSFSNSSAYEVFSNLGKKIDYSPEEEGKNNQIKEQTKEISDRETTEEKKEEHSLIKPLTNNSSVTSFFSEFSKIKSFFDFDVIIIALLITVIFFNKETNDKLTPLALLAIIFL